jgi:hypothetical protein
MDSGRAFCIGKRGKLHQGQMCPSLDVANFHSIMRDARVRVPQMSKFGGWLTAGADCVHHKYTKVECVLQAASNIDKWVAGIFYSREAVECHN